MPLSSARALHTAIEDALPKLRAFSDDDAKAAKKVWTRKQELGHLIDSAANNHQRFVRAALDGSFNGPSYDGDRWVELHDYAHLPWTFLVEMWAAYNMLLARVIERVPEGALESSCTFGKYGPMPLSQVIDDYVAHLRHHVDHIAS